MAEQQKMVGARLARAAATYVDVDVEFSEAIAQSLMAEIALQVRKHTLDVDCERVQSCFRWPERSAGSGG